MKYFALLTKLGENLLAQATALGTKLELTHMAVGDGGGSLPTPDTNQTKLIKEQRRAAINTLFIDEQNKNQIIAEQIIPEKDGGWWIREIGLFDKAGNLIAVANCPETYKPQLEEGSGRTQSIRMVLIVSHTESVTLKIDPSVVLATREYVNTEITVIDKKIDALSAQTKLDLTKKFDKANISSVKGNDNDKVPSLNLFTGEIGKLQPKGDYVLAGYSYSKTESDGKYQPKGDYATNTALNNGLNTKFNKAGGEITGEVKTLGNITAINAVVQASNTESGIAMQLDATFSEPNVRSKRITSSWRRHVLQDKDGIIAHLSDVEAMAIPIGSSIIWNTASAIPSNFWANEGRSFSATEYPALSKVYPNLKLPDDRGYAIRIADNGRGVDTGRVVGTYQEDAMRNLTGKIKGVQAKAISGAEGVFSQLDTAVASSSLPDGSSRVFDFEFNASNQVPVASEFRMKNVAKILITRVK
ncbi:phage tail protein [Providencia huaxiensis]|uniref:phage tail protein n=1 Tax=Providencia huaxiensis TaxID=2027290 RepID=UPI0032D9EB77